MLWVGLESVVVLVPAVQLVSEDTAEAFVMVVDTGPEHIAVDTVAVEAVDTAVAFVAGCIAAAVGIVAELVESAEAVVKELVLEPCLLFSCFSSS